jgi:hypothetical protein
LIERLTVKLDAFYEPKLMPDYGGPYFNLRANKLVQLDIRDLSGDLIPPWKMFECLRPGTVILASCTLHCFVMNDLVDRKVCLKNQYDPKSDDGYL